MKKQTFYSERIYPVLFMVLVTVVFISAISGIHIATQDVVLENETLFLKKAVLASLGLNVPEQNEAINQMFDSSVTEYELDGKPSVFVYDGSGDEKYAFRLSGPGLWGEITSMIGFEKDLHTMTGIQFISQNETPGLGARIEEEWFKAQFIGKVPPFTLVDEGTENNAPDEVDGITGATYTSRYVRDIVNGSPEKGAAMLEEVR